VHEVQVRDFMMAGNLKNAFADVVIARQKGLAALEKARGETAAVRSLANSAQLMEKHPGIMQLRLLQAVENSAGNRVVIALDPERGKSLDVQATSEVDT
jgi:regulator of protease activity HflC (stomatin/prohibitin superfamily)